MRVITIKFSAASNFVSEEILTFVIVFGEIELSNFEPIVCANPEPICGHAYESNDLNVRESPNESRVCVESSEKPRQPFFAKEFGRALCANLASSADGYAPAALSRAKG